MEDDFIFASSEEIGFDEGFDEGHGKLYIYMFFGWLAILPSNCSILQKKF